MSGTVVIVIVVLALVVVGITHVVVGRADFGMLGAEGLQADLQGLLVVPDGLVVLALVGVGPAEVDVGRAD